jgi:hypothetical protein
MLGQSRITKERQDGILLERVPFHLEFIFGLKEQGNEIKGQFIHNSLLPSTSLQGMVDRSHREVASMTDNAEDIFHESRNFNAPESFTRELLEQGIVDTNAVFSLYLHGKTAAPGLIVHTLSRCNQAGILTRKQDLVGTDMQFVKGFLKPFKDRGVNALQTTGVNKDPADVTGVPFQEPDQFIGVACSEIAHQFQVEAPAVSVYEYLETGCHETAFLFS